MKRHSMQRELIFDALTRLDHPTAPEIYEEIRKTYPRISLGTIYRNLGGMAEEGSVIRLSFPDSSDRFDCNAAEHTHVLCSRCGRVLDIDHRLPHESLRELDRFVARSTGVKVEGREILFRGVCPECLRKDREN